MKTSSLKKSLAFGATVAALALTYNLHAGVSIFIEGGSASQSILYDRATNFFAPNPVTGTPASGTATVRRFTGNSANPALASLNPITIDINVANGAINGLVALVNQSADVNDTNVLGTPTVPTFVDSATTPEAVGIDSIAANLTEYPTYVVPLVYVKNANYPEVNAITNLTQRQAVSLETSTNKASYYGGTNGSIIYFVGRNSQAAVRTEIDLNIYNTANIKTYTNNSQGFPVQDKSADPGLNSGGAVVTAVTILTNSIGTIAVQNIKSPLVPIAYEGLNYSVSNVITGAYPLWGYEHYYFITAPTTGAPSAAQQAVIDAFYQGVTNSAFQNINTPVFTNNFVPNASMKVKRDFDGGQIKPLPNF